MSNFTPTPEQQAIIDFAVNDTRNLMVNALAGAAKTSTLVLLSQALPKTQILCLAFNKKIALEMTDRLPKNCTAATLNSLGHRAWGQYLGRRLVLDAKKTYRIVSELVEALGPKEQEEAWQIFADVMRNVDFAKSCGYIPDGHFQQAKRLLDDSEFFAHLEDEPSKLMEDLIRGAMLKSIKESLQGCIDFGDQLFMPTLWGAAFEYYPLVMVDEAQDLSLLNHTMLKKIPKKRLIAVGDPCQSIYGFRGAHQDSMALLKKTFEMEELSLTVSFRCPRSVVREAQWRAPAMQYPDWAVEGSVTHLSEWSIEDVPTDDTAIICRNNAPLFSMALRLLRDGRYPELVGNDLGKSLIKQLKKLGKRDMSQQEARRKVEEWRQAKLEKARNPDRVNDQALCLLVFINEGENLGQAIDYAERIMSVAGPVKLMTGHKSKGLEFRHVYILNRDLIKLKEQQDQNLLYVMQTRAKENLVYVESSTYFSDKDIEHAD